MNPLLPRRINHVNSFCNNRLQCCLPSSYTNAVRYISTRKPYACRKESHCPTEAQNRFSCRDAHSAPAHRRFQIHQEPFQPTLCCTQNSEEERPRGTHHYEFQEQGRSSAACCVLQQPVVEHSISEYRHRFRVSLDVRDCR